MVIYYLTHWEHPGVVQEHVKSRGGDLKNNPFCSPGLGEEWGVVDVGGTLVVSMPYSLAISDKFFVTWRP